MSDLEPNLEEANWFWTPSLYNISINNGLLQNKYVTKLLYYLVVNINFFFFILLFIVFNLVIIFW